MHGALIDSYYLLAAQAIGFGMEDNSSLGNIILMISTFIIHHVRQMVYLIDLIAILLILIFMMSGSFLVIPL